MSLISVDFFVVELNIPNSNRAEVQQSIMKIADTREDELLKKLLGYKSLKEFRQALAQDPVPEPWKSLRDGTEYTVDGDLYYWRGLVDTANKQSIIANYAYYWYIRKDASQTTGVGESLVLTQNANRTNPKDKQKRAWDQMIVWIGEFFHYMENHTEDFPDWKPDCTRWGIMTTNNL